MEEKRIKKIGLGENIFLEIVDASKKLAGDRWQVLMVARVEIPVSETLMAAGDQLAEELDDLKATLGKTVVFEQKSVRTFIASSEKDNVFDELLNGFIKTALPYLSRPEFPGRFIYKKYREAKEKENWYH